MSRARSQSRSSLTWACQNGSVARSSRRSRILAATTLMGGIRQTSCQNLCIVIGARV